MPGKVINVKLSAVRTRKGTYIVDWSQELGDEVSMVGDGRGFHDMGIDFPPRNGCWAWWGTGTYGDEELVFEGKWRETTGVATIGD